MLSQKYALYLSEHNIMIKVKPLKTQHLLNPNSLTMVVNCLCMQHIILVSCLDLCYTVNQVCFCMKTYTLPEAVNRILRCVKGSMNYVIRFWTILLCLHTQMQIGLGLVIIRDPLFVVASFWGSDITNGTKNSPQFIKPLWKPNMLPLKLLLLVQIIFVISLFYYVTISVPL